MASARHPEAHSPPTACIETLQVGYLHAVAAAAGCSLSQPFPDNGIDWHVSHGAPGHAVDDEVTIKVQLRMPRAQVPPKPAAGPAFSFTLDNAHLEKLARAPVSVRGILVVVLVPRSQDDWLRAEPRPTSTCGTAATGPPCPPRPITGRTPDHPCEYRPRSIFDDRALCEMMTRVGTGGRP